jgi:hypothetical protein
MLPFLNLSTDRALAHTAGAEGSAGDEILRSNSLAPMALFGDERDNPKIFTLVTVAEAVRNVTPDQMDAVYNAALEAMGAPTMPPERIPYGWVVSDEYAESVYDATDALRTARITLGARQGVRAEHMQTYNETSEVDQLFLNANLRLVEEAKQHISVARQLVRKAWYNAVASGKNLFADFRRLNEPATMLIISSFVFKCITLLKPDTLEASDAQIYSTTPRLYGQSLDTVAYQTTPYDWTATQCRVIHTAIWAGRRDIVDYLIASYYPNPLLVDLSAPVFVLLVENGATSEYGATEWANFVADEILKSVLQAPNESERDTLRDRAVGIRIIGRGVQEKMAQRAFARESAR